MNKSYIWALWGNHAKAFEKYIKAGFANTIHKTSHPSPLSVRRGFKGSDVFISINDSPKGMNVDEINWQTDIGG